MRTCGHCRLELSQSSTDDLCENCIELPRSMLRTSDPLPPVDPESHQAPPRTRSVAAVYDEAAGKWRYRKGAPR